MPLRLHDTRAGELVDFEPLVPGRVGMYVCGPTVYSPAHLGNCRTFVSFDVVFRTLRYLGYTVRYVRNVTDVGHLLDDGEDRMAKGARLQQLEPMEVAQIHTLGFHEMLARLNCLPPSIEPRATGHIPEQIEMIREIVANGLAYEANGSVYFDVPAYLERSATYGSLSGRKVDDLFAETRELKAQGEKRHPSDFAIWIAADDDVLQKWQSEWSVGFPGWHLECSAMSRKYLGETFDLHGGGADLKFPHHENEIAQNEASCGHDGARYWLHTNMLLLNGKKMSKSEGNSISPDELFAGDSEHVTQAYSPDVVRFFFLQAHYSSPLNMNDEALQAAERGHRRLMDALARAAELSPAPAEPRSGGTPDIPQGSPGDILADAAATPLEAELAAALAEARSHLLEDFNTPRCVASLFEVASLVNATHDGHRDRAELTPERFPALLAEFQRIVRDVLGLVDDRLGGGAAGDADGSAERVAGLVELLIGLRAQSRADRNYAMSDRIRDELSALGVELKDGKEGTSFTLA